MLQLPVVLKVREKYGKILHRVRGTETIFENKINLSSHENIEYG